MEKGMRRKQRKSYFKFGCTQTKLTGGYIMVSSSFHHLLYLHARRNFREITHTRADIYRHGLGIRLLTTTPLPTPYIYTI